MPWLYGIDAPADGDEALVAHAAPSTGSLVVAWFDARGVRTPDGRRMCEWVRDLDAVAGGPPACEFAEAGYEIPALLVAAIADDGWYRVDLPGLQGAGAWIHSENRFHSLIELLAGPDHLTYLDPRTFDGWIYAEPNGARTQLERRAATAGSAETPYEALGHAIVDGRLWLHVSVLDRVCVGTEPRQVARGWIPVKTRDGAPQAWFWSRGC
jgi:hypothetical protein